MVSPRFGEQFETVSPAVLRARESQNVAERRAFNDALSPVLIPESQRLGNVNYFKVDEQVKQYRYWTYIAVNKIAERASQQFPQIGIKRKMAGQRSRVGRQVRQHLLGQGYLQNFDDDLEPAPESHPLVELLRTVNPGDTWGEFLTETVLFLRLTGAFVWWLIPNQFRTERAPGGLPAQLMVLPTQWVTPQYDDQRRFRAWEVLPYADESMRFELPFEQLVIGKYKNPRSKALMDPVSPIQQAPDWIDNIERIEKARKAGFANGVNPDVLVEIDPAHYAEPDKDLLARIKQRFMERAANLTSRNGEPMLMPPGMTAKPWSVTNKEMDFMSSADQVRDNTLALHGVPPVIAGVTSDYNRATSEAATVVFCDYTINPLLSFVAGVLTEKVASLYDPRLVAWFQDCVPSNVEFELQQDEADFRMGAIGPDEIREKRGREAKGEAAYETGYLPTSMSPLDEDLQPEPLEMEPAGNVPGGDDGDDDGDDE